MIFNSTTLPNIGPSIFKSEYLDFMTLFFEKSLDKLKKRGEDSDDI